MEITEKKYKKISDFFLIRPAALKTLRFVYTVFPVITAMAYIILLIYLPVKGMFWEFLKVLLIPAAAFLTVTVFRKACNFPRPYELLAITPLIERKKAGLSFPSRHCASAFVISAVFLYFNVPVGSALLSVSICLAVSRVLAGVHFIRDVAVGAAFGLIFGLLIFLI